MAATHRRVGNTCPISDAANECRLELGDNCMCLRA